jgi:glycosyltransferase involved in cell wall biosynthesis
MGKKSKIYLVTQAYNAEATIGRAIQSALAQTYQVFRYYILDSASTDGTMDVINEYAKCDNRIVALRNDFNRLTAYMDLIRDIAEKSDEESVLAMLDADDTYRPDAFEKLLMFMNENDLHIAVSVNGVISAETGEKMYSRCIDENTTYHKDNYCWYLPEYFNFMRTVCGKLFSLDVLRKCDFSSAKTLVYGADTAFVFEAVKNSDCFGIMGESLYNYYYNLASISFQLSKSRVMAGRTAFETGFSFLSSFGDVGSHNRKYLLQVYFSSIKQLVVEIINRADCGSERKEYIKYLLDDPLTEESFSLAEITHGEKFALMKAMLG